jgi:hypothetical protein
MPHVFLYLPVYLLEKSAIVQLSIHRLFWLIGAIIGIKKKTIIYHYMGCGLEWDKPSPV